MEKNKDTHEIFEKDGKCYYSLSSVALVRNESSNKADIEIFKLSGKFTDAEEILLNEAEKRKRNENSLATLFVIVIIFFIGYFMFGGNSDKKEEAKQQPKQVEQQKIEKTPEQIQSEKEEQERAALQKKYDDQKKYEENLKWQEQQKEINSIKKWCNDTIIMINNEEEDWNFMMAEKSIGGMRIVYDRLKVYKNNLKQIPDIKSDSITQKMNNINYNLDLAFTSRIVILDGAFGFYANGVAWYEDVELSNKMTQVYHDSENEINIAKKLISEIQNELNNN